ncbi:MAG: response regulator [Candidatus Methanomethylicaceae archaeon]
MKHRKKVLVVDDATTVRMYHRQILVQAGFEVDEAINGVEGLEKALQWDYDLYLVDVNMPNMDGYTFVRRLRADKNIKQSPVVMITTESREKDKALAYEAGANLYLVKPVKPEVLIRYIRAMAGAVK